MALWRASLARIPAIKRGNSTFSTASSTWEEVVGLEHEAGALGPVLAAFRVGHRMDVDPIDGHFALRDRVKSGEAIQERRLTAAGRSHDRDHLSPPDFEVQSPKGIDGGLAAPVRFPDVSSDNYWFFHRRAPSRRDGRRAVRPT